MWATIQIALITAGYDLGDFEGYKAPNGTQFPDGADGYPGQVTQAALENALGNTSI